MLKNTELRIGNYIKHKDNTYIVKGIGQDTVTVLSKSDPANGGIFMLDEVEGIGFSRSNLEENLWKLDTGKAENYYVFTGKSPNTSNQIDGLFDIEFPYDNSKLARVWTFQDRSKEYDPGTATCIRYYHELQNLIFGITTLEMEDFAK